MIYFSSAYASVITTLLLIAGTLTTELLLIVLWRLAFIIALEVVFKSIFGLFPNLNYKMLGGVIKCRLGGAMYLQTIYYFYSVDTLLCPIGSTRSTWNLNLAAMRPFWS